MCIRDRFTKLSNSMACMGLVLALAAPLGACLFAMCCRMPPPGPCFALGAILQTRAGSLERDWEVGCGLGTG